MNNRIKILFITLTLTSLLISGSALFWPSTAQAQYAEYPSGWEIIPKQCLGKQEAADDPCDLNAFVQLFVNLAGVGLKILPILAMLMLIWAGFNLIMAGGNAEKIQEGKRMITSVIVGVIIVIFLAWTFSYFVVYALTGQSKIFDTEWWGGGEGGTPRVPSTGCCIIDGYGCTDVLNDKCQELSQTFLGGPGQWMGENQFCYLYKNPCDTYKNGCCVPKSDAPSTTVCAASQDTGCLDIPNTSFQPNDCTAIAQCYH